MLTASQTRLDQPQRRYVRPEDMITQPGQLNNPYGEGTEILAKKGKKISKAQSGITKGFNNFSDAGGVDAISSGITTLTGESGGDTLGGTIGGAIGSIWGPPGQAIGQIGGQLIGGLIDTNPEKIKAARNATDRNIMKMGFGQGMAGLRSQHGAYMQDGGNVQQNSMDGDLQAHEGGIEPVSSNPYGGETVMFKGPSHADGGMDVTYGNNPVEVEGGEPATEMGDDLVVFGNLKIPNEFSDFIGDPKVKGRKFKKLCS